MFCWELGPLHSTFVALPPPARASTRTQTAPTAAAGLMRLRTAGVAESEALQVQAGLEGLVVHDEVCDVRHVLPGVALAREVQLVGLVLRELPATLPRLATTP